MGLAATGQSTNDYWNPYLAPYSYLSGVPALKYADGTVSGAGLTVANGPGHWGNGAADPMYRVSRSAGTSSICSKPFQTKSETEGQ